jgi:glycerol-3-phosphate cytidylyltransferase-like family protein
MNLAVAMLILLIGTMEYSHRREVARLQNRMNFIHESLTMMMESSNSSEIQKNLIVLDALQKHEIDEAIDFLEKVTNSSLKHAQKKGELHPQRAIDYQAKYCERDCLISEDDEYAL